MVLHKELWNFDLRRKKHDKLPKTKKLWFIKEKTMLKCQKHFNFLNKILALELWFTMENYGTMKKTKVLYRKLWNFDLLWNYDTMEKL